MWVLLHRIEAAAERVTLSIDADALRNELGAPTSGAHTPAVDAVFAIGIPIPIRLVRRGSELKLILAERRELRRDRQARRRASRQGAPRLRSRLPVL